MESSSSIRYVGFWRRTLASIIDSLILLFLTAPLLTQIYGSEYWVSQNMVKGTWDFLLSWVFPAAAIVAFWLAKSATPGKLVVNARIVDANTGQKPEVSQWILRYLGYYVALLPLGLGILWVAFDKKKQGLHDKMARTVVIRTE